jgi:hypothetical protein
MDSLGHSGEYLRKGEALIRIKKNCPVPFIAQQCVSINILMIVFLLFKR